MWFRMPDPPFQPLGRYCLHIYIPQSIPLSACGGFIGLDLRTLVGRTLCGLRLASTCAPIIAWLVTLVKGFSEIFSDFFAPLVSPLPWIPFGAWRAYRNPRPALTPTYPSLVATSCFALRFTARASHRNLLALAIDSLGDHPPSMVLLYHTRSDLSRVFWDFFVGIPNPQAGISGSQDLYFVTMASPCSATIRVPRRGWGSHPLLTLTV